MYNKMGIRHIVRPKLKTPKVSVKRVTAYKAVADRNGKPALTKNDYRKIIHNIIKG